MPRPAKSPSSGSDNTRHLSAGILALCFPAQRVQAIIDQCGKSSSRIRDLPSLVIFYYILALSLYPAAGYEGVLRWLLTGLQWLGTGVFRVSSKGALTKARKRLGEEPMQQCFEHFAQPLANQELKGSFWRGFHLVALDGSTLALQDTKDNDAAFGRSSNQNGQGAYPLARYVVLAEVGTHMTIGAAIGKYHCSELRLADTLVCKLKPGMLCLADRLFPGYDFWCSARKSGAHLLWRVKTGLGFKLIKQLADGSWLAHWPSGKRQRKQDEEKVRVIEYCLRGEGLVYRLITTILDPKVASAEELAKLYPQRWEVELTIKESKSTMRHKTLTLRSKLPEMVRQEFYGLLLAHYAVRKMMALAAQQTEIDPDEISFKASVEIIRITQTGPTPSVSP